MIGYVLQMFQNFHFCPEGSTKGQKMTFLVNMLSQELCLHSQNRQMIFWEMIGYVLQMCYKFSEFSFYPEGSNEGRKTTFLFFCKVCHLNYIYIFRSRQLIPQDMIGHVLQICNKDSEFAFCPLGSYEGGTMTFSVIKGMSIKLHFSFNQQTNDTIGYEWLYLDLQMCNQVLNFYFHPWGQMRVEK